MSTLRLTLSQLKPKVIWPEHVPPNCLCRFDASGNISCTFFPILRHTKKGIWIRDYSEKERFINLSWKKRFAHATPEEAFEAFIHRKRKQITILTRQLSDAEKYLKLALDYKETLL